MKLKVKKKSSKRSDERKLLDDMEGDAYGRNGAYGYDSDGVSSGISSDSDADYGYGYREEIRNMPKKSIPRRRGSLTRMVTRSAEGLHAMKQSLMAPQPSRHYDEMFGGEGSDGSMELKGDVETIRPPKKPSSTRSKRGSGTRRTKSNDDRLQSMRNHVRAYDQTSSTEFRPYNRRSSEESDHSYEDDSSKFSFMAGSFSSVKSGKSQARDSFSSIKSGRSKSRDQSSRSFSKSPSRNGSTSKSPAPNSRRSKRRGSLQFLSKGKEALDMIYYDGDESAAPSVKSHRSRASSRSKSNAEALRQMQLALREKEQRRRKQPEAKGGILSRGLAALENIYDDCAEGGPKRK